MYTVTYTNTDGNQMKLLLTDAEFERGLHRAQENPSDTAVSENPKLGKIREIVGDGDPCAPNNLLGDANSRSGRGPING